MRTGYSLIFPQECILIQMTEGELLNPFDEACVLTKVAIPDSENLVNSTAGLRVLGDLCFLFCRFDAHF